MTVCALSGCASPMFLCTYLRMFYAVPVGGAQRNQAVRYHTPASEVPSLKCRETLRVHLFVSPMTTWQRPYEIELTLHQPTGMVVSILAFPTLPSPVRGIFSYLFQRLCRLISAAGRLYKFHPSSTSPSPSLTHPGSHLLSFLFFFIHPPPLLQSLYTDLTDRRTRARLAVNEPTVYNS